MVRYSGKTLRVFRLEARHLRCFGTQVKTKFPFLQLARTKLRAKTNVAFCKPPQTTHLPNNIPPQTSPSPNRTLPKPPHSPNLPLPKRTAFGALYTTHVGVRLGQGCVLSPLLFIVYMNWIDKCSQADECATIGNCKISRLLFADDLVLLSSTESGLQCALNSFADACNTAEMKISTAKTEVLHLSRNPDQCVLQVNGATLKQVEKFKYLGVAFTSDGRQDEELDTRIGKASAVMRALHYSVVMKRELSKKAKLSIFKAVFVPILTYGHESWVMTERMRSQVQASEMRFLRRIEGVTLFNKVRSSEIRKSLNIEPLLLRIEKSQLRWFGHVSRMPQERLPKQALHAKANGRRPVGRPRTRWTDYIEDLGWNRLGLRPSEMMDVIEDREVWRLNLELLPPQPSRKSGQ